MKNVEIKVEIQVNEIFAKTIITQELFNDQEYPLELEVFIKKNYENYLLSSFNAQIGDSTKISSKVIKEEKAEEKYADKISSGNAAIYATTDKQKEKIIVHIGNIPPKKNLIIISEFLQLFKISNNYQYELEIFDDQSLPLLKGKKGNFCEIGVINYFVEIKTKNKIEKIEKLSFPENLVIKEEKFNEEKTQFILKFDVNNNETDDLDKMMRSLNGSNHFDIPIGKIFFKLETNYEILLFSQLSKKYKDEQSFILNYQIRENDKVKLNPGFFIFLIDPKFFNKFKQNIIEAFPLLLYSIPAESYFQLIIDYKSNEEIPKEYNEKNIKECLENIEKYECNPDGTNLNNSLRKIYQSIDKYENISLPKYIYLLTDGNINDKKEILNIIDEHKTEFEFSIHIFGENENEDFLKKVASIGNGNYGSYKKISDLSEIIVSDLFKISYPYIYNFDINSDIDKISLFNLNSKKEIMRLNKIYNFNYITKEKIHNPKNIDFVIKYNLNGEDFFRHYKLDALDLPEGEELFKLNLYNYIKNNENLSKEEKIKLAIKHQILIEGTSLFAEVELKGKIISPMKLNNNIEGDNDTIHNTNKKNEENIESNPELQLNLDSPYNDKNNSDRPKPVPPLESRKNRNNNFYDKMLNKNISKPNKSIKESQKDDLDAMFSELRLNEEKERIEAPKKYERQESLPYDESQNDNLNKKENQIENEENELLKESQNNEPHKSTQDEYLGELIYEMNHPLEEEIRKNIKISQESVKDIIFSQNICEGFWNINSQTELVKSKYLLDFKFLRSENYDDITSITILIIYFLNKEHKELSSKLAILFKKAKLYIKNKTGISYKKIVSNFPSDG